MGAHGQVWPTGRFGISVLDRKIPEPGFFTKRKLTTDEETFQRSCALHGLIPSLEVWGKASGCQEKLEAIAENRAVPLDLSIAPNSHRPIRGQNGISSNGRLQVQSAAYLLQQRHTVKHLSFLTLTLPTTSSQDNLTISEKWPQIVRVFVQWLGRALRSRGLPGEVCGVTEIQENRSEWQEGILGLHLHLVFCGRQRYKGWVIDPLEFREAWVRAVKTAIPVTGEGYYWGAVENVAAVRKDASRYLGKYLSKGAKALARFKVLYPSHRLPSCWTVCTLALRHAIKNCKMGLSATAEKLHEAIERGRFELFTDLSTATFIGSDGREHICGWYGTLSLQGRKFIGLDDHVRMRLGALAHASGKER